MKLPLLPRANSISCSERCAELAAPNDQRPVTGSSAHVRLPQLGVWQFVQCPEHALGRCAQHPERPGGVWQGGASVSRLHLAILRARSYRQLTIFDGVLHLCVAAVHAPRNHQYAMLLHSALHNQ